MNAYELADDVKNISNTIEALEWVQKASPLLRQQADRIAELEHMNKNWQLSETMAYNRIAELEKGGEVAGRFYWESVVDGHVMAVPSEGTPHYNKDDFPLYTAPRELSDEEIKAIANNLTCTPDKNWNVLFAKAILKKASEK